MARKANVVIEKDEHRYSAWCRELEGCQSRGATVDEALSQIKETIELTWTRCISPRRQALRRLF